MQLRHHRNRDQIDLEEALEAERRPLRGISAMPGEGETEEDAGSDAPWIDRASLRATEGLYPLYFPDELDQFSRVDWLIPGVIQLGEVSLIYGPGGLGKSALIQDWMLCVSYGLPVLGKQVKRRVVLYICAEGASGVRARLLAARAKYGKLDEEPAFIVTDAAPDLIKRRGEENPELVRLKRTLEAIQEHSLIELGAVVIDTQSKCLGDGDENSNRDMNAFVNGIYEFICKPCRAATIVITHCGKDVSRGVRGATAVSNGSSAIFRIAADEQLEAATLTCEKQKEGKETPPFTFVTQERWVTDPETGEELQTVSIASADDAARRDAPVDLSQNQRIALGVLKQAQAPLSKEEWRDLAQHAGLNANRPAAFREAAKALLRRQLAVEVGDKYAAA